MRRLLRTWVVPSGWCRPEMALAAPVHAPNVARVDLVGAARRLGSALSMARTRDNPTSNSDQDERGTTRVHVADLVV